MGTSPRVRPLRRQTGQVLLAVVLASCTEPAEITVGSQIGALHFSHAQPRNLIVIGIDTLRRDAVGRYIGTSPAASRAAGLDVLAGCGGPTTMTPFLDGLLREGLTLDNHRACSNWTNSGLLCFASGRSQLDFGYTPSHAGPIPDHFPLLPERLGAAGFTSALVSNNGFVGSNTTYDRFFDTTHVQTEANAEAVTALALDVLEPMVGGEAPWFLQIHYVDPHFPYAASNQETPGSEFLESLPWNLGNTQGWQQMEAEWEGLSPTLQTEIEREIRALYADEVSYVDAALEHLFDQLLRMDGALQETLVLIWSDHGEQFWEHGNTWHGFGLYPEETAAVGSFWTISGADGGPGLQALTWEGPTTQEDLLPSVLAALGLPEDHALSGEAIGDAANPSRVRHSLRFHESALEGTLQALEQDNWLLHFQWDGTRALYDLQADRGATRDLSDDEPEIASRLWGLLEPQIMELAALNEVTAPEPTPR